MIIHKNLWYSNETGIDISLTVAYHHKFHHQNKKKQPYIVCWYVRNVYFRRQKRFFSAVFAGRINYREYYNKGYINVIIIITIITVIHSQSPV